MMNLSEVFKRLIGGGDDPGYNIPIHSEEIERSPKMKFEYAEWLGSDRQRSFIKLLRDNYELRLKDIEGTVHLQIFRSRASNGFYFAYDEIFTGKTFSFLFDYFKDRVEAMGYVCKNDRLRCKEVGGKVKRTEMYYLKPRRYSNGEKFDQKYGNVYLESVAIDEVPQYIKCMVNIYSDHQYKKHEPFETFIEKLLDPAFS